MKIAQITMLLLWVFTLASCSSDFEQEVDNVSPCTGQVTFLFDLQKMMFLQYNHAEVSQNELPICGMPLPTKKER